MEKQRDYYVQARKLAIKEMRHTLSLDTEILRLIYGDDYEKRMLRMSKTLDKFERAEKERKIRWIEEHLPF